MKREKETFDCKHLTLEQRKAIESGLKDGLRLNEISAAVGKDARTVSKEIRRNRNVIDCSGKRRFTNSATVKPCTKVTRFPYVCLSCDRKRGCTLDHYDYDARDADEKYRRLLRESRSGVDMTRDEATELDAIVREGVGKGQSIYAICVTNPDRIRKTPNTIYTYIHKGLLSTSPVDLRRSAKMKPRVKSGKYAKTSDERAVYVGRSMSDFYSFQAMNPGCLIVQADTVEGSKDSGKCLLTLHFVHTHFMIVRLISGQVSSEVKRVLDEIEGLVGTDGFKRLFPCLIPDRGKEFVDPQAFETSTDGKTKRTSVYFCDAMTPNQKPHIERNHELIRFVIPKGAYMDDYTDEDMLVLTSTINSYVRKDLGGKTPYELFEMFYGEEMPLRLLVDRIDPKDVNLTPSLLARKKR